MFSKRSPHLAPAAMEGGLVQHPNQKLGTCIENVRSKVPLVHNITNYVTVNDVANVLLA